MTTIPNELIININTSVPGYQKLRFKPSMIIKNISNDDSTVRFNPMIKLSKSIIDKVPENLRKKQFFNKGLFLGKSNIISSSYDYMVNWKYFDFKDMFHEISINRYEK